MTRLRYLLSILAVFITAFAFANCPSDAKWNIIKLTKQGGLLVVDFAVIGNFEYNIRSVSVANRSLGGMTQMKSVSGNLYELRPGKTHQIIWNVKEDVYIIEDIRRNDFVFELVMTESACNYYEKWHRVRFGMLFAPFTGLTFGNKSVSRGLGLSYELGFYFDKKLTKNTRLGLDLYYAQHGMGLDRNNDVIFRDESYDMKRIRLRLRSYNLAPSIQWKMGDIRLFTGLTFSYINNGKLKLKADPDDGGKEKIKVPIFENTEIFEIAEMSRPINRSVQGWFIGFDWLNPKEDVTVYVRIGGQFHNMLNADYWFWSGQTFKDVLGWEGQSLNYTYFQWGMKYSFSKYLVKYKS